MPNEFIHSIEEIQSEAARSIEESLTIKLSAQAKDLKDQGKPVIGLTAGEPHIGPPEHVREALRASTTIDRCFTYTANSGLKELREKVAAQVSKDLGHSYTFENVIITAGAKPPLTFSYLSFLNPGEEVIIPAPFWLSYAEQVKIARGMPKIIPCGSDTSYKLTPEKLKAAITPNTKVLLLNSPSNPTGLIYSKEELQALAAVIDEVQHPFLVISDEMYAYLVFEGHTHYSLSQFVKRVPVLIISGWSKSYSLPGARIGWAAGPKEIIKTMISLQSHGLGNAPHPLQYAVMEAYSDNLEHPRRLAAYYQENAELAARFVDSRAELKGSVKPQGAFFYWLNIGSLYGKSYKGQAISNSFDFSKILLEEELVSSVPGEPFGDPNAVRISLAIAREELEDALSRLERFFDALT